MIESNFEYTENLINKINTNSVKRYNLVIEIAMFVIFLSAVVLFVTGNILLGVIFSVIFAILLASVIITNRGIAKNNRILVGQRVSVKFNDSDMLMTAKLGNKVIYNAKLEYGAVKKIVERQDLIFIYFGKESAVVVPKSSFKTGEDYQKAMQFVGNNYVV